MAEKNIRLRCVVADDIRASRELIGRWMGELGMHVATERDGQSALVQIESAGCDLLITDIEMPHVSGLQLLQRLRSSADPALQTMPVIFVTSLLDQEVGEIIQQLDGTTVLVKPLDKIATQTIVKRVLDGRRVETLYDAGDSLESSIGGKSISPTLRRLIQEADEF